MRKLLGLLVVAISAAAFAVEASNVAFASTHSRTHSRTHSGSHSHSRTHVHRNGNTGRGGTNNGGSCTKDCGGGANGGSCPTDCGGGNNGGSCPKDCGGSNDGSSCPKDCGGGGCQWDKCKRLGSPGADCTDNRLGLYSRVTNVVYICLVPKNNLPQASARSQLICETPTSKGGQGGTYISMDGLDYTCLGPSGPQ
jgi:hypothetical protein